MATVSLSAPIESIESVRVSRQRRGEAIVTSAGPFAAFRTGFARRRDLGIGTNPTRSERIVADTVDGRPTNNEAPPPTQNIFAGPPFG
jgi:hypothetical protein